MTPPRAYLFVFSGSSAWHGAGTEMRQRSPQMMRSGIDPWSVFCGVEQKKEPHLFDTIPQEDARR